MTANISLPGSGKVLSSRETAAGEQIQQVQLDIGESDVESPVSVNNPLPAMLYIADGIGGFLPVDNVNLFPCTVVNGPAYQITRPEGLMPAVSPTLDTNVYADGDVLFTNEMVTDAGSGYYIIRGITVIDTSDQGGAFDIYLFNNEQASMGTRNSAPNIATAGLYIIGKLSIAAADYYDLGSMKVAYKECNIVINSSILKFSGVSRDTKTYAENGLRFNFALWNS